MRDDRVAAEAVGGVPVVTAPQEIDITSTAGLRTAMLAAAVRGHGTFVVDMTRTRFYDSAGLQVLAGAHKRARAEGSSGLWPPGFLWPWSALHENRYECWNIGNLDASARLCCILSGLPAKSAHA